SNQQGEHDCLNDQRRDGVGARRFPTERERTARLLHDTVQASKRSSHQRTLAIGFVPVPGTTRPSSGIFSPGTVAVVCSPERSVTTASLEAHAFISKGIATKRRTLVTRHFIAEPYSAFFLSPS